MTIYHCILLISLLALRAAFGQPIARHQLVVLDEDKKSVRAGDTKHGQVIRLKGFDQYGTKLTYIITKLPLHGTLYQLSHVYSLHGYPPIAGIQITSPRTIVSGSMYRVYYVPTIRSACSARADAFSFITTDGSNESAEGNVSIVDADGTIVCSDFLLGTEEWTVIGNKEPTSNPVYEPYSRDQTFSRYIHASDNTIHMSPRGETDRSRWYFQAPSKFLGDFSIAYGGNLRFSISLFAGDITRLNKEVSLVELECKQCGYKNGITLAYPLSNIEFMHNIASIEIALLETAGWQKYPRDSLKPSKCEFIQVLSRLSGLRILGDISIGYETVALDNVYIQNNRYDVPAVCNE